VLALAGHVVPARVGAGVGEEGGERRWRMARGRKHAGGGGRASGGGGKRGVGWARACARKRAGGAGRTGPGQAGRRPREG